MEKFLRFDISIEVVSTATLQFWKSLYMQDGSFHSGFVWAEIDKVVKIFISTIESMMPNCQIFNIHAPSSFAGKIDFYPISRVFLTEVAV